VIGTECGPSRRVPDYVIDGGAALRDPVRRQEELRPKAIDELFAKMTERFAEKYKGQFGILKTVSNQEHLVMGAVNTILKWPADRVELYGVVVRDVFAALGIEVKE
jgi:hypothetical protein